MSDGFDLSDLDVSSRPDVRGVATIDGQAFGGSNTVINSRESFTIHISWRVSGDLVSSWLKTLSVRTKYWVVTAHAQPRGSGSGVLLARVHVAVGGPDFADVVDYSATLTVPAGRLAAENPHDPHRSGVYQIFVETLLDSSSGRPEYDMVGYADFPLVKVEGPEPSDDSVPREAEPTRIAAAPVAVPSEPPQRETGHPALPKRRRELIEDKLSTFFGLPLSEQAAREEALERMRDGLYERFALVTERARDKIGHYGGRDV